MEASMPLPEPRPFVRASQVEPGTPVFPETPIEFQDKLIEPERREASRYNVVLFRELLTTYIKDDATQELIREYLDLAQSFLLHGLVDLADDYITRAQVLSASNTSRDGFGRKHILTQSTYSTQETNSLPDSPFQPQTQSSAQSGSVLQGPAVRR